MTEYGVTDDGVDSCLRGNDVEIVPGGNGVSGQSGGCFFSLNSRVSGNLWIPAFAGMTEYGVTDDGVDSRLRGNDGVWGWIPACAGLLLL